MKPVIALLVCLVWTAQGRKPPQEWDFGKVLSQVRDSQDAGTYVGLTPGNRGIIKAPIVVTQNFVTVETEHFVYQWIEKARRNFLVLPVNGTVWFYRDGDYFIVVDGRGRKHKFVLVSMRQK